MICVRKPLDRGETPITHLKKGEEKKVTFIDIGSGM